MSRVRGPLDLGAALQPLAQGSARIRGVGKELDRIETRSDAAVTVSVCREMIGEEPGDRSGAGAIDCSRGGCPAAAPARLVDTSRDCAGSRQAIGMTVARATRPRFASRCGALPAGSIQNIVDEAPAAESAERQSELPNQSRAPTP